MGIWAARAPLGNFFIFNAVHPIQASLGWQAVWWFGAILAALALALVAFFVSEPPGFARAGEGTSGSFAGRLRNKSSWLLAVVFGAFAFSLIGYNTWAPSFLTETLSVEPSVASLYASLLFLAGIPGNIIAGWTLTRTQRRYRLLVLAFATTAILFAGSFQLGSLGLVAPYMMLLGFASNFVPTAVFTLAPETMDHPALAGLALAIASSLWVLVSVPSSVLPLWARSPAWPAGPLPAFVW
jgi:predicted MFS family arabinose efflux permease